ncbi:MAG: DUF1822 family protein [Oscillatoria princeps RMCB-10]|nr:DUF1822 family protein [Oscillatoria princeps RMCB-10]
MVTKRQTTSQERLEKALKYLGNARQLERDLLTYGLDAAYLYVEDVDGDWLEKWGEDEEEGVSEAPAVQQAAPAKNPVNLGQWLQQAFETGWQAVEEVLKPQQLDCGFRSAEIRRAKLIELGAEPARHPVALSVTLKPEGEGKTGIFVGAHAAGDETYLPEELKLSLLSPAGEVLYEERADSARDFLEVGLAGESGELFSVKLALGDASVTEDFAI